MRKHMLSLSLLSMLLIAASSVAYSYYNEAEQQVLHEERIGSEKECTKTEEIPWETLTKKLVGLVNL